MRPGSISGSNTNYKSQLQRQSQELYGVLWFKTREPSIGGHSFKVRVIARVLGRHLEMLELGFGTLPGVGRAELEALFLSLFMVGDRLWYK